jgi:PKD repeat protein
MRYFTAILSTLILIVLFSCEKKEEEDDLFALFKVSPSTGSFNVTFTFDASASYDEAGPDDNLQVRWDWNGDDIFDTEYSTVKVVEHKFEHAGHYDVVLEVVNAEGWTDQELKTVIVFADSVPPSAAFTVLPDTGSVNTIFFFNASSTADPYDEIDELRFRWDWENDGTWDTPFIQDTSIYHKYEAPGNYQILLEVKNSVLRSDTAIRKIFVYDI